jgi:hypothetical protein
MNYIHPEDVSSPKERWETISIIYDEGVGEIAVAIGQWDNSQVIAIRWNGQDEEKKEIGNPQSSGHATWFILPDEFGIAIVKEIILKKAAGNKFIKESGLSEAVKWMKGKKKITDKLYE